MRKAKVFILGYLPPPQEGTAKITEVIIKSKVLRDQFDVSFLSLRKVKAAEKRGKLALLNVSINLLNLFEFIVRLLISRPHLVYMPLAQNSMGFVRDSLFILLSKLFFRKTCVHFHGGNFDLFYLSQNKIRQAYIRFVISKIDCLIVLADKFKEQFKNMIPSHNIYRLFNCLPDGLSVPFSNHRAVAIKNVLFFAYLSKAKGALDVVYAIPEIIKMYGENVAFTLCGQPVDIERNITFLSDMNYGYSKILDFIKTNNIDKHITLKPKVAPQEKDILFSNADIFVFPTYSEGCGLVALEAMAFGLPVITTKVGALSEMLKEGENCFFVEPGDIKDIANKITYLLQNHETASKMSFNNTNLVHSAYNINMYVKNLADIWYNCLLN